MKNIFSKTYWENLRKQHIFIKNVLSEDDLDFKYIYIIIEQKLIIAKRRCFYTTVNYKNMKWIDIAINICKHFSDEDYSYPEYINYNNANRFKNGDKLKYEGNADTKNISGPEMDRLSQECLYNIKAKYLLFNILNTYIKDWWK